MLFGYFRGETQKLPYFPSHVLPSYIITKTAYSSPLTTQHVKENRSLKKDPREGLFIYYYFIPLFYTLTLKRTCLCETKKVCLFLLCLFI